ncbi:MAG: methylenetetrahydrofolate reductase, partial [Oscillospiraceae bacterium]
RYKIGFGATHLITQLFFDNDLFYTFLNKARETGINVPIEAGIMPIVTTRQIERTVALSGASLPVEFTKMVNKYSNDDASLYEAGIEYATNQIINLLENGVNGIHLYTMNNPDVANKIYANIKDVLKR